VKPMQTAILLKQIEALLEKHSAKLARLSEAAAAPAPKPVKKSAAKRQASKTLPASKTLSNKSKPLPAKKKIVKKPVAKGKTAGKKKKR